jgi:penicillin-binding protein 1A
LRITASTRIRASIRSASAARSFRDLRAREIEEGASTLTQQLARTIFLTNQQKFGRKFKEMVIALMIERRLDKQQILELYLNRIFLGGSVYGVEAMSRNVFGKRASDLALPEAAFIAGIIQMPSALVAVVPLRSRAPASHVVLRKMREEKFITA